MGLFHLSEISPYDSPNQQTKENPHCRLNGGRSVCQYSAPIRNNSQKLGREEDVLSPLKLGICENSQLTSYFMGETEHFPSNIGNKPRLTVLTTLTQHHLGASPGR